MNISVVIPMYNSEKTIVATLDSVFNQKYLPKEIIVVNDGSNDNSLEIVSDYISKNIKISVILIDKENGGVSSARNEGMKIAKGDWIALLDSDDVWLPNKLQRQKEVLEQNPQIDFLGCNRNGEFFKRVMFKKLDLLSQIKPKDLMFKFLFVVPTVIFRRTIVENIGFFNETQRYAEEGNYFIRISNKYNCYLLNESYVITGGGKNHFGDSGLTANLYQMEKGELKNLVYSFQNNIINIFEFIFFTIFSILKYFRRVIIVKLR
jgi:glycosyltransferase involved in cell wall biosynthesis